MFFGVLAIIAGALTTGLWRWVDSRIVHVEALSGAPATPGTTILVVGSDSRDGWADDGTEGARTDTIILIHQPESGPTAMISIPRDTYVEIDGYGPSKINAAFSYGGAPLLVSTVEQLSGFTIDRYVEVGFAGVTGMVDAVGGVDLCYDSTVVDELSGLNWEAGCHTADGATALAFARMRYSDPLGDIGRTQRQQQVISAVVAKAVDPSLVWRPREAYALADAGLGVVAFDQSADPLDLIKSALVFRDAQGTEAIHGTPPIATIDYRVDGAGSTVLLDPDLSPTVWAEIAAGTMAPGTQVGGY